MKALIGLVAGALLTYLYLQYGYSPPVVLDMPGKLAAMPQQLIASSFIEDADASMQQRQQAIAMLIRFDPGYFVAIDNAIGNRFTEAAVARIAQRRLALLKGFAHAFEQLEAHPALLKAMQERYGVDDVDALKRRMLIGRLREEPLAYRALQQRYPGYSDGQLAAVLLGSR